MKNSLQSGNLGMEHCPPGVIRAILLKIEKICTQKRRGILSRMEEICFKCEPQKIFEPESLAKWVVVNSPA
jgi:hypothetical protein